MSPNFTPVASAVGGVLIGLAASLLLLVHGRVAGVSGITGGLLAPKAGDVGWRVAFLSGLWAAGLLAMWWAPERMVVASDRGVGLVGLAGLLVGYGTRLGSGCTSGHGVCGLSRGSPRSLVSVGVFMAVGVLTAMFLGRGNP